MTRYFNIFTLLISLSFSLSVKGQLDTTKSTYTILEYGLPSGNGYLNARATIADKWNIQFNSVAGCIVSKELTDSVEQYNKIAYTQIIGKYGKEWRTQFDLEVTNELEQQTEARTLIDKQPFIIELDSTLALDRNGLNFYLTPEQTQKSYSAIVFGWGDWNGKTELVIYYKLNINLVDQLVRMENDEIELLETE